MKRAIALLLMTILLISLFGCAKAEESSLPNSSVAESSAQESSVTESSAPKEPATVAVCMGSIDHPVHRIVQTGFMLKAEELGMTGVISGLDEGSMPELIDKWSKDIKNKNAVGALIWSGDDSTYEMMKELKTEGVYVVVPHFAHSYYDTHTFIDKNIYADGYIAGQNVADFIVDTLQENGITEGSIGITQNGPGVTKNDQLDGFRDRMKELNTNYTVLDTIFEGAEITEATNKITRLIENNFDIVAIFGTTGGSPQSISNAIENTGRTDLITIGYDYTELNMDSVESGIVTGIVCLPLYDEGAASAQALYDLYNGAVFNTSEETWYEELEAPIATAEDIPYYRDIYQKMYDFFGLE